MSKNVKLGKLACGALLLGAGCDATLGGSGLQTDSTNTPTTEQEEADEADRIAESLPWPAAFDGEGVLARRLSRDELLATLATLVGVTPARERLPEEPRNGHGLLLTGGLSYIDSEVRSLWTTISDFTAEHAVSILSSSGCGTVAEETDSCLASWAQEFAARSLRRDLSAEEQSALASIVEAGGAESEDQEHTVESVLNAVFFSPSFLFRFETGEGSPVEGELADVEIAERLSFLATLGPPDDELLAAARAGALRSSSERVTQFQRLAATPEGAHARAVFLLEWLNANEPKVAQKSAEYLEGLAASFPEDIRNSVELSITDVLASLTPTVAELFKTTNYLAHPAVQSVVAESSSNGRPSGDSYGANRAGLLLHPYVVAAHTKENGSSPFQVGIALRETVLCAPVSPPPAGAQDEALTDPAPGLSERQRLEYVTSATPVCSNCHAQFAPMGYSFLPLDPVGRWQAADPNGSAWDLTGEISLSASDTIEFASPTDLSTQLGQHPQVLGCFTQATAQWTFGRRLLTKDAPLVERLNDLSQESAGHFFQVFQELVASPEFIQTAHPAEAP